MCKYATVLADHFLAGLEVGRHEDLEILRIVPACIVCGVDHVARKQSNLASVCGHRGVTLVGIVEQNYFGRANLFVEMGFHYQSQHAIALDPVVWLWSDYVTKTVRDLHGKMAKSALVHSELIEVRKAGKRGRGVFARIDIPKDQEIEKVPVIVVPAQDVFGYTRTSKLANYVFNWKKGKMALALGFGSLYNHSYTPNAQYYIEGRNLQSYVALRDIRAGEEITINYNSDPQSRKDVGFGVVD